MLELSPPINEKKKFNNFLIFEKTQIVKVNLRGDANNKDFTGKDICRKRDIDLHFNRRDHRFSSTLLRQSCAINNTDK